jgi:fluoride exporter
VLLFLMIGVGGMIGAYARYRLSVGVYSRLGMGFPWGTLAVNLVGSFLLGLLLPFTELAGPFTAWTGFVTLGCVGAFTTFSTFAFEAVALAEAGLRRRAALYVAFSLSLGIACVAVGLAVGWSLV